MVYNTYEVFLTFVNLCGDPVVEFLSSNNISGSTIDLKSKLSM